MADDKYFDFNPEIRNTIRYNIRKRRKELGYTQEKVALMAEISYDFMRRIETNTKVGFSIETLYKISVVLEISVDKLMDLKHS